MKTFAELAALLNERNIKNMKTAGAEHQHARYEVVFLKDLDKPRVWAFYGEFYTNYERMLAFYKEHASRIRGAVLYDNSPIYHGDSEDVALPEIF